MVCYKIECFEGFAYFVKRKETGKRVLGPNIGFFYFLPRFVNLLLEDKCAALVQYDSKIPLEERLFLEVVVSLANDRFLESNYSDAS